MILGLGAIVVGLAPVATSHAEDYDDPDRVYNALRIQRSTFIQRGGRTIRVVFADGAGGLDRARTLGWVARAATTVHSYFGQLPVTEYGLLVIAENGNSVGHATTFGYAGAITRIRVGTGADNAAFARDWVLVHEMLHTALPDMPRRALWLQEGNATWVEPVARAAVGQLPISEVWRQAVAGMARGEPGPDDGGMDGTTVHDRLYWGGATFWLRAEIAILEQSGRRRTLRDAMRAINRESGGNIADWKPEQMMAAGDRATGTTALSSLYQEFATRPVHTNLAGLFGRLGVVSTPSGIAFDDRAPLADIRRRITAPA